MEKQSARSMELTGVNDKRQITAVFCRTLTGDFLPIQLIYQGKTSHCHPHYSFLLGWHVTHSEKHWSNEETMIQYVHEIIIPYVAKVREDIGDDKRALWSWTTSKAKSLMAWTFCWMPTALMSAYCHQIVPINYNRWTFPSVSQQRLSWKGNSNYGISEQVAAQLEGHDVDELESLEIQPIDMSLATMKQVGAKWLMENGWVY